MNTRTYFSILFIFILSCIAGCKSSTYKATEENTQKPDDTQAETQKPDDTQAETPKTTADNTVPVKEAFTFKSLKDASDAADVFMTGLIDIANKVENDCSPSVLAMDKYYHENIHGFEKAMKYASNIAANDDEDAYAGQIFTFYRSIEMGLTELKTSEKLGPCTNNEQLKSIFENLDQMLAKYEPAHVANEGLSDDE